MDSTSFIGVATGGVGRNNPTNMRPGDRWIGLTARGQVDGFLEFSKIEYGIRAAAIDMINNINNGVNTIRLLTAKWSPASDGNDPAGYAYNVASMTTIDEDEELGTDADTIASLVRAFSFEECGASSNVITDQMYEDGVALAGNLIESVGLGINNSVGNALGKTINLPWYVPIGTITVVSITTSWYLYYIIKNFRKTK